MNSIKVDIIDYIGKYENGVLVLLSINCDDSFSEGTLYYNTEILALTVDESVEKKIECPIELWEGYRDLIISILKRVVPYDEIINRMDEVDFSKYFVNEKTFNDGEEIDEKDIKLSE